MAKGGEQREVVANELVPMEWRSDGRKGRRRVVGGGPNRRGGCTNAVHAHAIARGQTANVRHERRVGGRCRGTGDVPRNAHEQGLITAERGEGGRTVIGL